MPWQDTLPDLAQPSVQGWFNAPPEAADPVTGWWAAIDLDTAITVQFVTDVELRTLKNLNVVRGVSVDRAVALQVAYTLALQRGLTATMNLGLRGTFFLDLGTNVNFGRVTSLVKVRGVDVVRTLNFATAVQLGRVYDLGGLSSTLVFGTGLVMANVQPIDLSISLNVNRALDLVPARVVALTQSLTVNQSLAMGFPPTAALFQNFTTVGAGTYTIPRWCDKIAMIALGGGGGGQASAAFGAVGKGGYNGEYGSMTVERGVDIPYSQTTMAVDVGAGGAAGVWDGTGFGKNGEASTVVTGAGTLTGPLGAGGVGFGDNDGESPGNLNYDGISAVGGATQTGNAAGNPPGGGGAGSPSLSSGYAGARGQVWFRAYQ